MAGSTTDSTVGRNCRKPRCHARQYLLVAEGLASIRSQVLRQQPKSQECSDLWKIVRMRLIAYAGPSAFTVRISGRKQTSRCHQVRLDRRAQRHPASGMPRSQPNLCVTCGTQVNI